MTVGRYRLIFIIFQIPVHTKLFRDFIEMQYYFYTELLHNVVYAVNKDDCTEITDYNEASGTYERIM